MRKKSILLLLFAALIVGGSFWLLGQTTPDKADTSVKTVEIEDRFEN